MARVVGYKKNLMRALEGTLDEPLTPPIPEGGLGNWASWGPCLLHRTFHDRQVPCYTDALSFSFSEGSAGLTPQEAKEAYWAAVERAILDDFKKTGEL